MFATLRTGAVNLALKALREKFLNAYLDGIGVVKALAFKDKTLQLTVELAGLEEKPITVEASNITIAPNGEFISAGNFTSDMPFVQNALNKFATRTFEVPEGKARMALCMAKKALDL